jgi:thiamine-phosphate pyrophosphorylase
LNFAAEAEAAGANYIAFGRFFQSVTKPGTPQATPVLLEQARQRFKLPVVAIGGITLNNAPHLIGAGASMLAVINGLFAASSANEVEHRARGFTELFQSN